MYNLQYVIAQAPIIIHDYAVLVPKKNTKNPTAMHWTLWLCHVVHWNQYLGQLRQSREDSGQHLHPVIKWTKYVYN